MTDDDHIDDDADLQLKQMRSVWLSMRDADAEPGDRGMAALMAAAREQAEAMKPKRSWLAVLLDQLRRPPVLALATVVVLIGGAVVISQRNDRGEMQTESEMTEPAVNQAADTTLATPTARPTTGAPSPVDDGVAKGEAPGGQGAPEPPPPVVTQEHPHAHVRAKAPGPKKPAAPERAPDQFSTTVESKPEVKKEDKAPMELAAGDEDMQPKGGVTESTSAAPPVAPDHKSVSRKPLPRIEGEDRASRDTTVAQLIKQCEAAAAKNDCAAVRTIAQKIAKQDPSTYRLKVAKNAAVARCLEPPAPVEAAPPESR